MTPFVPLTPRLRMKGGIENFVPPLTKLVWTYERFVLGNTIQTTHTALAFWSYWRSNVPP